SSDLGPLRLALPPEYRPSLRASVTPAIADKARLGKAGACDPPVRQRAKPAGPAPPPPAAAWSSEYSPPRPPANILRESRGEPLSWEAPLPLRPATVANSLLDLRRQLELRLRSTFWPPLVPPSNMRPRCRDGVRGVPLRQQFGCPSRATGRGVPPAQFPPGARQPTNRIPC